MSGGRGGVTLDEELETLALARRCLVRAAHLVGDVEDAIREGAGRDEREDPMVGAVLNAALAMAKLAKADRGERAATAALGILDAVVRQGERR